MKKKLSKVVVLLVVVAFALTGCLGGSSNGGNDEEVDVGLENSYTEASSYFTFDYPADWEVIIEDLEYDDEKFVLISNQKFDEESGEMAVFLKDDINIFMVEYQLYNDYLKFDNEEEFKDSVTDMIYEIKDDFEKDDEIYADIEIIEENSYQVGGQPGYRALVEVTNIYLEELEDLNNLDMNEEEFEEFFGMDYDEYLENGFAGFMIETVLAYHNNFVHELNYMSGLDSYSANISEAIFDSFNFVD